MLDEDLAVLYAVATKRLNQAVRRGLERFPPDFMFELTLSETRFLRSQIVTLDAGRGRYRKYRALAFTEHGVAMLASVLRSRKAVATSVAIVREFIRLRSAVVEGAHNDERIVRLEKTQSAHERELGEHAVAIHEIVAEMKRRG